MRVGVSAWYSPPDPNASPTASTVRPPGETHMPIAAAAATRAVVSAARVTKRVTRWLRLTADDRNAFVMSM